MDHNTAIFEPLSASIHCDSGVQHTRPSVFYNLDHEESPTLGSTSSALSNSTLKVGIANGLRNVDVNLDAR